MAITLINHLSLLGQPQPPPTVPGRLGQHGAIGRAATRATVPPAMEQESASPRAGGTLRPAAPAPGTAPSWRQVASASLLLSGKPHDGLLLATGGQVAGVDRMVEQGGHRFRRPVQVVAGSRTGVG